MHMYSSHMYTPLNGTQIETHKSRRNYDHDICKRMILLYAA
jgi:hypothetical protein